MEFVHGQDMPSQETENLRDSLVQSLKEMRTQLFRGPHLWEHLFKSSVDDDNAKLRESSNDLTEEEFCGWYVCSISNLCKETESQILNPSSGFSRVGLEEALTCSHNEQSDFKGLSDPVVTLCLHIACVVFLNCFLMAMSFTASNTNWSLPNELADIYQKWKWDTRSLARIGCWDRMVNTWLKYVQVAKDHEKEEAMKLLYQWTRYPLLFVVTKVRIEMDGLAQFGDEAYSESQRVSKWGDELCSFLEQFRVLFKLSKHTEFLYFELPDLYKRTALLHMKLGDNKVVARLLEAQLKIVEGIGEKLRWVATWDLITCKTTYDHERDPAILFLQREEIILHLKKLGVQIDGHLEKLSKERKDLEERGAFFEGGQHCSFLVWCEPHCNAQLANFLTLICRDRFIEAREVLRRMNLEAPWLNARLRDFFASAVDVTPSGKQFISHRCDISDMSSSEWWEYVCRKLDFLLEICDVLGDQQLTAKVYEAYGARMCIRFLKKLRDCQDAPTLKLLLIEELKLQPNCPAPECVRELLASLDEPCESNDNHKLANLPDSLKGFRFLKRSIGIYSDLVDKFWAQRGSDEAGWLRLLESQKSVHDILLRALIWISIHCHIELRKDEHMLSKNSVAGSQHSSLVLKKALDILVPRTLLWAEKGRATTLQNQLGPWYEMKGHQELEGLEPPGSLKKDMIFEFQKNHEAAMSSIMSCHGACKGEHLFIEYVSDATADGTQGVAYLSGARDQFFRMVTLSYDSNEVREWVDAFFKKIVKVRKPVRKDPVEREDLEVLDGKELKRLDKRLDRLNEILENLYEKLIEPFSRVPIFEHLHSGSTIIFVPDKLLYRVPFALLRDKKTHKHLFQLHPISVSPSLRILQHLKARECDLNMFPLKTECILAVGNAAYKPRESLPGTGVELKHLQSLFGRDRVKTLEKDGATRANFLELVKEASTSEEKHVYAFMHLGVHGRWNEEDEEKGDRYRTGCLQFAKPPHHSKDSVAAEENGLSAPEVDMLSSEDIIRMGMEWRARLVVLSACDSSRGQIYSDGEINLPRALTIAGVPTAVVSQWKISDAASSRLMEAFYKNLQCGQEVAKALQSAMLELANDQSSKTNIGIFEWGPFLVWGLPTLKLPKELWTENARKTLHAKEQVELLRDKLNAIEENKAKVQFLEGLRVVETFLEAMSFDACTLEDEDIVCTVMAIDRLLERSLDPFVSNEVVAIAEEFYKAYLPLERVEGVDLIFEKLYGFGVTSIFRKNIIFVHTMKGSYQIALDLANKLVEDCQNTRTSIDGRTRREIVPTYKQERAVILRLIGEAQLTIKARELFDEALKDFEEALEGFEAVGEAKMQFFCLIQMSYLKTLLEDESGALACALQAKEMKFDWQRPGQDPFLLCSRALPAKYCKRLFNVGDNDAGVSMSLSDDLTTVHLLNKRLKDPNASLHARHLTVMLKADTDKVYFCFSKNSNGTLQEAFIAVETFLTCALGNNTTLRAIVAIEELFSILFNIPRFSERIAQLVEYVYLLAMPSEQLEWVEQQLTSISLRLWEQPHSQQFLINELGIASSVGLDKCEDFSKMFTIIIRKRIMYVQAMGGRCQIALEHANKAIKFVQNTIMRRNTSNEAIVQALRVQEMTFTRERGVVLRLLGEAQMKFGDEDGARKTFVEAQNEFDKAQQALGENYECLIQTSYLKYLMKDESGQMLAARRAKRLEAISQLYSPGYGAFVLSFKALPEEYREWLLHADACSEPVSSSSVWVSSNANSIPTRSTSCMRPRDRLVMILEG